MIRVFSGVFEDLIDQTDQYSTDDEFSTHLVKFVEVLSIMSAGDSALRGCKNRCASRLICGVIGHVSMQKRFHKSGATWLWDNTSITAFFGSTRCSHVCGCILGLPQWFRHCVLVIGERRRPYSMP